MNKVFKLEKDQEIPEGYAKIIWKKQPHEGTYAIKPKETCEQCNGSGKMTLKVHGVASEYNCNCVNRRFLLYISPGKASERKAKEKVRTNKWAGAKNEQLEKEIERLVVKVTDWNKLIEPIFFKYDDILRGIEERIENIGSDKDGLYELLNSFKACKTSLRLKAESVLEEAREKANDLMEKADNLESGEEETKKVIDSIKKESLLKEYKKQEKICKDKIAKVGGGQARRDRRRLKKLTERLEERKEDK